MERRFLLLGESRPSARLGVAVALGVVAGITLLIYPLREVMPAVSTGVIYLIAVLAISTFWALWLGLLTSLLSAAAFNFFHIPPTGYFHVAEAENWVAIGALFIAAVLASTVAELARARADEAELRRREAVLAADMARLLLGGRRAADALEETAMRLADALQLPFARIVLAPSPSSAPGARSIPLRSGNTTMGVLMVPADSEPQVLERLSERIVPALETLLSAAIERERLQAEAIEADALRQSDEIKTAVLRAVSHDLRTPLTAIVASADALSSAALSSDERTALSDALTGEASRLARLVDQLLDLSRLEAGAAEPRRDWCSVEEIASVAAEQAGHPSQFELSVPRDLPLLHADAAQLERAMVNVLENAARHSGERRASLRARVVGPHAVVRVVDDGPGIPVSELDRVFQPFHRGNGASSSGHRGSGLGLAIAKGFIEANGGRIRAESPPGQGTTIVIELPLPVQSADRPLVAIMERSRE